MPYKLWHMENDEIRYKNLEYWADKLGRDVLATKAGWDGVGYINRMMAKYDNVGKKTARKLEAGLELEKGWFDLPHPDLWIGNDFADHLGVEETASKYIRPKGKVPVISWMQAGKWRDSPDNYAPGDAEEWLECPFPHSDGSFYLVIVGDSMYPEYLEGEYILVDPAVPATHGKDVVMRTPDGTYTFKRLQITHEGTYLLALNPDHPNRKIQIPDDSQACGVVTSSLKKR